jgi:hypothetical protein
MNIARLVYAAVAPFVYLYVDIVAALEVLPFTTLFKCATTQDLLNMMGYFINIAYTLGQDFIAWLQSDFFKSQFTIINSLASVGTWLDAMIVPLECFCRILFFIPRTIAIWARMPSLHYALNCIFNIFVRIIQIPMNAITSGTLRPEFNHTAIEACCALHSTGEAVEDSVFLIAETFWGVFTNSNLPGIIALLLSTTWSRAITGPLCGVVIFTNMTLTAVVHYDGLVASDGSGIGYLQFGTIADELKDAADAIGQLFVLLNNDAQAFVTTLLWVVIDVAAFVFEWIPGNIWYFIFGGPLPLYPSAPFGFPSNFLRFYFPDYWLKATFDNTINNSTYVYHTALSQVFNDARMTTQALGNLVANLLDMDPLAGVIQHTLNIIVALVEILCNLISFIYTIITFDSDIRTTMRAVNTNPLFNELYFLAGSAGDMFRQYQAPDPLTNLTCQASPTESDKTLLCCLGNLVERALDVPVVTLQQTVNFAVDLITLPTGTVRFCIVFIPGQNYTYSNVTVNEECIRIPDFSTALFLMDEAICDFTCALFSIIPLLSQFECIFPQPGTPAPGDPPQQPKDCGHVSTCGGNLLCKILRVFTAGLHVVNTILVMFTNGTAFYSIADFGGFLVLQYADVIASSLEAFGLLINCVLCAFLHVPTSSPNCDDSFYQLFYQLGLVIRQLARIITDLSLLVLKLFLTLLVGFFTGNPIGAVIDFIVGILVDVFGGLGTVVVNFLVSLFNSIGLGFIGTFIDVLWRGFCPLLQTILNIVIIVIKALTFGTASISTVEFCCNGGNDCIPSGAKRSADGEYEAYGLIDGKLYVNISNWVDQVTQHVHWDSTNPCNTSMRKYRDSDWLQLSELQQGEVMFCLMKPYWLVRNDSQPDIGNATCDRLMIHYNNTFWDDILIETQSVLMDCMNNRLFIDAVRIGTGANWFPSDWLTNDRRKYYFVSQVTRGLMIYWQFKSDQEKPADVIMNPAYRENWANMGLNTSHYNQMNSVDDIIIARHIHRLKDYFVWNNATQYDAVAGLTVGFWSFIRTTIESLQNTTTAMTDNNLDPSTYLSFGYSLGNDISGASSSVWGIVSHILSGIKAVATFWSDPANLKKRHGAADLLREGGMGIYVAGMQQIKTMGLEYFQYKQHESEIRKGLCPANETQEYLEAYERSMHHNEHSMVFKLSRWWYSESDRLFKNYPISSPRDGDRRITYNQTKYLFSYTDVKGREIKETGRERVYRLYNGLMQGTPASNRRWDAMWHLWTTVKEAVYVSIIRHHLVDSINYVRRVYQEPKSLIGNERPLNNNNNRLAPPVLGVRKGIVFGDTFLYQSQSLPNNMELLRTEEQRRYCGSGQISEHDGLCLDYISQKMPTYNLLAKSDRKFPLFTPKIWNANITVRNMVVPHELPYHIIQSRLVRAPVYYIDGFLDIVCLTNITLGSSTLCEECLIFDQLVGRVIAGLMTVINYFVGGQFGASLDKSMLLFDYLFDENAVVVAGDGPSFRFWEWPLHKPDDWWYNLRPFGDDTPNKLYFNDIFNSSNTNPPVNGSFIDIFGPLDDKYINTWMLKLIISVLNFVFDRFYQYIFYREGNIEDFLIYLANVCVFCDWLEGHDFLGTNKRTSLGEAIFVFFVGFVALSVFFFVAFGFNLWTFLFASSSGLMVFLFLFLTFYANWSWLCWYALPAILADDIMYFSVYTLLAKCSWFWSFLIADDAYDNTSCYSCDNTRSWTIINCMGDLGFGDILANIVFMLQLYWPEALQWIRDSPIPPISIIYRIPWVSDRLNQFSAVNLADVTIQKRYIGCNYFVTLIPNLIVLSFFALILVIIWPAISFFFGIFLNVSFILTRMFYIIYLVTADIFESMLRAPYLMSGIGDVYDEPNYDMDEGGGGGEDEEEGNEQLGMEAIHEPVLFNAIRQGYDHDRFRRHRARYYALNKPIYMEKKNHLSLSMITNMYRKVRDYVLGHEKNE